MSKANPGQPIQFQTVTALTQDMADLHTYGNVFDTKWVTVHDTKTDGMTPFNANQLAKDAKATPLKRPENGQFRPGTQFREFFFDETGDTDATSAANPAHGGWGAILKLVQTSPSAATGKLTMFFRGDQVHTGLDNVAFWSADRVVFVEDAGDLLHGQRNALDSAWMFEVRKDYSKPGTAPVRIIAQGRDPSATIDSALTGTGNEGDNEITGMHVSDGDPSAHGLLGAKVPTLFESGWRVFYTGQHGENVTFEVLPNPRDGRQDDGRDEDQQDN
jgi:secreted PhoX family phosphatase